MTKIQKSLAKLYFALGESGSQMPMNAEITEAAAEYMAFLAIRDTGKQFGLRYFAMGAASAHRRAVKPPRGKTAVKQFARKGLPPGGKEQVRSKKAVKSIMLPKKIARKLSEYDLDGDFDMEGDE